MSSREDVTDSTDWLQTPLAALTSVESSLRCQVCKDFYTTPMITSCSHTFCSLCIRRYLSQEGKCPACRESDQEIKLRRNWVVEELVEKFQAGRKTILDFARSAKQREVDEEDTVQRPSKRRRIDQQKEPERRSTRSQSRKQNSQNDDVPPIQSIILDSEEEAEQSEPPDDEDATYTDGQDTSVKCPVCGKRVKETLINVHLDSCIGGQDNTVGTNTSSPRRSNTPQIPASSILSSTHQNSLQSKTITAQPPRDRLPTINYSMLTDNALRKKLRDLGISSIGSKETMRKRHTEWVNLWNANCDARHPVTKSDLLRELNQWERTLGRQIDKAPSGIMVKEFDRDGWRQSNKSEFDDLIAQARAKRKEAADAAAAAAKDDATKEEIRNGAQESSPASSVVDGLDESMPDHHSVQQTDGSSCDTVQVNGTTDVLLANSHTSSIEKLTNGVRPSNENHKSPFFG